MKQRPWLLALIPIVLAIFVIAGARQIFTRPSLATLTRRANGELRRGHYEAATRILADVAARDPGNGAAWFRLGYAHHTAKSYSQAIEAYQKAFTLNWIPETTAYNMACAYARRGETGPAVQWLETALREGFRDARLLETDADLDSIRSDRAFAALMARFEKVAPKAGYTVLRPLLGTWTAFDEAGIPVGTVEFRSRLKGQAVEQRTTFGGREARVSLFYFNPQASLWKQVEAREDGSFVERIAKPQLDGLRFEGWAYPSSGGNAMDRVVFTASDQGYRLEHEMSNDSGRTWKKDSVLVLKKAGEPKSGVKP